MTVTWDRRIFVLLLISCLPLGMHCLSIDCGEFYDDESLSPVWGYVYYSCNGTIRADSESGSSNVTELYGMHKYGRNSTYLQRVVLIDQNLTHFPASFQNIFPYLQHIILSFNAISRITNDHLSPFKLLNILKMEHNQITYLEGNLFDGLRSLILVDFSYNNIKHIGEDITLPGRLNLRHNPCIDLQLDTKLEGEQKNLFVSHIKSQCALPMTRQASDVLEGNNVLGKSSIIIDRTGENEPEPITQEPSIDVKPPKMGETMNCGFARLAGVEVTERCRQILELIPQLKNLGALVPKDVLEASQQHKTGDSNRVNQESDFN